MANSAHPEFLGCAKYDLKNNKLVGKYHYPGKLRGGEVFFVPSHTDVSKMDGERVLPILLCFPSRPD